MATKPLCSVDGCGKPWRTLGMCGAHYLRHFRGADVNAPMKRRGAPRAWIESIIHYDGDECRFWPFARRKGYAIVADGKGINRSAARVVCRLIHGDPPDESMDTAHACGNGHLGCMTPRHLSWKTHAGNMQDAIGHGTTTRGEKNAQSTLTSSDVLGIRAMAGVPYKVIAAKFSVTPSAVGLIMRRERWGWLA